MVAAACAAYPVAAGRLTSGFVPLAGLVGVAMVLAGVLALWEDGLVLGPAAILVGYAFSLAPGEVTLDRGAPLVAVGLLAAVELGSWSLELRDGAEERVVRRLGLVVMLIVAAGAASLVVLSVGSLRTDAGIVFFAVGGAAALGLFALLAGPAARAGSRPR